MRRWIEYIAVVSVREIVRVLPDSLVRAWGSALGRTAFALDRPHRRVALANLAECFPNKSEAERRAIARGTFRHFGQLLLELHGLTQEAVEIGHLAHEGSSMISAPGKASARRAMGEGTSAGRTSTSSAGSTGSSRASNGAAPA